MPLPTTVVMINVITRASKPNIFISSFYRFLVLCNSCLHLFSMWSCPGYTAGSRRLWKHTVDQSCCCASEQSDSKNVKADHLLSFLSYWLHWLVCFPFSDYIIPQINNDFNSQIRTEMLTKQHFILVMLPDARRQRVPLLIPEGARNRAGDGKRNRYYIIDLMYF